jgi:predicted dehydrogenase
MCGYNRTFAPFTTRAKALLETLQQPKQIFHRMADWNPYRSGWLLDESLSGGRLIGEAGHVLDMMCHLAGADPIQVFATGGNFAEPSATGAPDSATVVLSFPDESSGVLLLSSIGSNLFPKEEVQIFCAGHTINITNFQTMKICGPESVEDLALPTVDKGHKAMLDVLSAYIHEEQATAYDPRTAFRTTHCTLAALRSVRTHQPQQLTIGGEEDACATP